MRWYEVLFRRAAALKKSTLRLLREIVTLIPSSFITSCSGDGRKSGTTSASMGSLVYLIFLLINSFTLAPVACPNDADHGVPVGETHGQYAFFNAAKTVIALFRMTMG
jgi:hypothetical protein